MIINGVELECDVLDVTTLKAIKQGSERVANINKEIAPIQDEIEQIEAMCHIIFDFSTVCLVREQPKNYLEIK